MSEWMEKGCFGVRDGGIYTNFGYKGEGCLSGRVPGWWCGRESRVGAEDGLCGKCFAGSPAFGRCSGSFLSAVYAYCAVAAP